MGGQLVSDSLADRIDKAISQDASKLTAIRRHLHQHPELSGNEFATTAFLREQLTQAGISSEPGPGGLGLLVSGGQSKAAKRDGPLVALRADIDALPIPEENRASYRSQNPGVMHACGHDAHATMLLGAVLAMHSAREQSPVAWRAIFQPSEEAGHGARAMVRAGALDGADGIVALHVDPTLPAGRVGIREGHQTACCQDFSIEVRGRGGHGARPHLTVDPIAVAAELVGLIYQAVPRGTDARDPVVVTIGEMRAGKASNVIPDLATLTGTIRALDAAVLEGARAIITRCCRGLGRTFRARIRPVFDDSLPGVFNDPRVTAICMDSARAIVGPDRITTEGRPSMGAEDFADYLAKAPGCMMRLGVRRHRHKVTPLHTATFDIEENALLTGARLLARVLFRWKRVNER